MIDTGTGPAVVTIPGIQGRWEWMAPTIRALGREVRAVSFSLAGDRDPDLPVSTGSQFHQLVEQIDWVFDRCRIERASLCGVSFGGLVALRYARSRPHRVDSLILVSTPGPGWTGSPSTETYLRHPRLLYPVFSVGAARRAWQELRGTFPDLRERLSAAARHGAAVLGAPAAPTRMAGRARHLIEEAGRAADDCAHLSVPTLVVTGGLDRVVPPASSKEYLWRIPGATGVHIEDMGHLGVATRPERLAHAIADFVRRHRSFDSPPVPA